MQFNEMVKEKFSRFYAFVGPRATLYGGTGIASGFVLFLFDLALATMLQRFFMATGLITLGSNIPLGFDLQSPIFEGILLVCIGIFRGVTIWGNGYLAGLCQVATEVEKRQLLTQWAISRDGQEIGQVMSYFNDITVGAAAAIGNVFYLLARFVMLGGIILVMMSYSLNITIFVMLFIVILAPVQMIIDRIISKNSARIQSSLANAVSFLSRAIKNNLFLSLHNLAEREISHIQSAVGAYGQASVRYYSLSSLRSVIPQILGLVAVVVIAIQGHSYFSENPSLMIAYLYMVLRMFQTLSDVARVSGNTRLNYPRIALLYSWWCDNIYKPHSEKVAPVLQVHRDSDHSLVGWRARDVSYVWPNGKSTAIQNLNFSIEPGSITLIVGPSGAGKTTLFHMLLGLILPTGGTLMCVTPDGHENVVQGRIPHVISYVGSEPFLVAGSVRDQLLIGNASFQDDALEKVLRLVHADFVFEFKGGLDHLLTEQGHGLSAGQKQRLALARALLRKPSVLLLDEATANLDEQTEGLIMQLINSLRGKMSIVVVSHRPHTDLQVDQIINLGKDAV